MDLAAEIAQRQDDCARIESVFSAWLILWGPYSRRFWAFPAFRVPPGTIVSARDPNELAGQMKAVQRAAAGG